MWARIASSKSTPPSRSMPSGLPRMSMPCGALAQHGGVERAAAEVVHGDRVAVGEVAGRRVVGRGRLRLGDHPYLREARELRDLLEQLAPVGAPVGGVGEHDVRRRGALGLGDLRDGLGEQRGEQRRHRVRGAAEHDGRGVAEAALELAADPVGVAHRPAVRGLARDERAVVAGVDHRRRDDGAVAEGEHLHPGPSGDRGRDEGRAEVHPQAVHPRRPTRSSPPSEAPILYENREVGSRYRSSHHLIDVRRHARYGWPHRWWGKPYPAGGDPL